MKTAKILSAVALPLMLAACNQDAELENLATQGDYSNIPMVDVTFTANKGTDTRMATQFGWQLEDKIGMAWLGDGTLINPEDGTNGGKAYQNTPFYCSDAQKGSFKSENLMYVGTYFAYMPFRKDIVNVNYIPFSVEGQTLSTNSNDYAPNSIYITPSLITLEEVAVGEEPNEGNYAAGLGQNLPLNMRMLSNPVTLDLTFDNAAGLADLKVTKVSISLDESGEKLVGSFDYKGDVNTGKDWSELDATGVQGFFTTNAANVKAAAIELTNKDGLAVVDGKLTTYALLLPAKDVLTSPTLTITLMTNYGEIEINKYAATYDAESEKGAIQVYDGAKTTAVAAAKDAKIFTQFGQNGKIAVKVDAKDIAFTGTIDVESQSELEDALKMMATTGQDDAVTFNLNSAKDVTNFTLTDFTMPEGLKAVVTLTKGTKVATGLVFAGNTVINNKLTLGASTPAIVQGNMTVKAVFDAVTGKTLETTLDLDANNLTIDNDAVLTNEGQIGCSSSNTITTTAANSTKKLAAGKYVSATKNAKFDGKVTFTNNGEVQWIAGTLPANTTGLVYAEVNNLQEVSAADAANVTTVRFKNQTSFDNFSQDVTATKITTIEVYAPVTIALKENAFNSTATTLSFSALTKLNIMKGGSLTVTSDNEENTIAGASSCEILVEKDATLELSDLTLGNFAEMNYAGTVTFNNVDKGNLSAVKVADSDGVFTEK